MPGQKLPDTRDSTPTLTTNEGAPVFDNVNSWTIGRSGPIVIQDAHFIEKLGQLSREKVPERVVHARGVAAKGYFEVTDDITEFSCADVFREVGAKTPVFTRFSVVTHSKDVPESIRDVRGFAVKFYTRQGNWDLVGNNIPVFFVRDSIEFPDLVHCLNVDPQTNVQEGWRIMDYLSHHPESCHMLTFLFDDVGVPASYRHMDGFGVNTFVLVNAQGRERLAKFHWLTRQGVQCLMDEEAAQAGGKQHNFATLDLFQAIARGESPEWRLCIQVLDPERAGDLSFDPLDPTKTWPEDQFPLIPVGKMVLDTNVDNFHNETEQVAFCPANVVPGIDFSDDKLLQGRIFSYQDTQRYRIGTNFQMLPVNAPQCPFHLNNINGAMNFSHREGNVNYYPSHREHAREAERFPVSQQRHEGPKTKQRIEKENNFQQAGERWRSWDHGRQQRFVKHFCEKLCDPRTPWEAQDLWVEYWTQCDQTLGQMVKERVQEARKGRDGAALPPAAAQAHGKA